MRIETPRLVLDLVGPEHAADLFLVHSDPNVAYWSDAWWPEQAAAAAAEMARQWQPIGVKIIYERGLIEGRDGIHAAAPFAMYWLRREDAAPPPAAEAR